VNGRTWRLCQWAVLLFAAGCILGIAFAGCAWLGMRGQAFQVPDEAQAVWITWHDVYHRNDRPPRIRWVTGDALNCTQHPSGISGFKTAVGCRGGFTLSPLEVSVALHPDEPLSDTPLAHELMHALEAREGVFDPDHSTPQFRSLDKCGSCANDAPVSTKDCRPDDAVGIDCTTIQSNPCDECGLVEWATGQLQRRGM
jgi:hypothetical protein